MNVLGIIPARGGSTGIPRKNIRNLCGKPLLQYTAEAALAAARLTRVILTTDDEEIAEIGRACGIEVPFLRPGELAQDDSPTLPVVQHALSRLEADGAEFDAICLLQPTHPLRTPQQIDACIALLDASGADTVVTILPVPPEHNPQWVYFSDATGQLQLSTGESSPIPRRQELPPAFHREGSIYVTRRDVIIQQDSLYGQRVVGYPISPGESVNLDTEQDWERATRLLAQTSRRRNAAIPAAV